MDTCSRCGTAHPAARPCAGAAPLAPRPSDVPLAAGAVLGGRFRVDGVAHRSGMSTVYSAADLRNQGQPVALKEFAPGDLSPSERAEAHAWLAREAALLSRLANPRLPRLLAVFVEGDRHYVAMPFLAGETLEERIKREGAQPETLVLGWGRELAGLLRYLHAQEPPVVHRDLKPANVLLRPDGTLVLLDLGVARELARSGPASTPAGTAVGTPGYAAPEQYQGLADERSDLYGLGATLHRALTGYDAEHRPAFQHPNVLELAPDVGVDTAALMDRLLELAPERRHPHADAVLEDLAGALRGAFARAYRPLHCMYGQVLALVVLGLVLGGLAYRAQYGVPMAGGASAGYRAYQAPADALGVLAIVAPGLLAFLPLLNPGLRALTRRNAVPRMHRNRVAKVLLLGWGVPLVVWQFNLIAQRQGNLVAVPGHAAASAALAIGSVLLAVVGLLVLYRDLRRLQVRLMRVKMRYVLLGGLIGLWPVSVALQAPPFHGSCYMVVSQSESQTQFGRVRGLGVDGRQNLYILDDTYLRERTPDNRYHLLLDTSPYDHTSPLYPRTLPAPQSLTTLAVAADGRIALGDAAGKVYRLTAPGHLAVTGQVPNDYTALAFGPGETVYYLEKQGIAVVNHGSVWSLPPEGWGNRETLAMASDGAGGLYVLGADRVIAHLRSDGRVLDRARLAATDLPSGLQPTAPSLLNTDYHGAIYYSNGGGIVRVDAAGAISRFTPNYNIVAVAGLQTGGHPSIYVASDEWSQSLSLSRDDGSFYAVGGSDSPTMRCNP